MLDSSCIKQNKLYRLPDPFRSPVSDGVKITPTENQSTFKIAKRLAMHFSRGISCNKRAGTNPS